MNSKDFTSIPTRVVGPIKLTGDVEGDVLAPLATYESPLWPSVQRGARISQKTDGIFVHVQSSTMTRSLLFQANSLHQVVQAQRRIQEVPYTFWEELTKKTTSYGTFRSLHTEIVGNLLFVRLSFDPSNASGHNMATKAAQHIGYWIECDAKILLKSVSANLCTDKKVSSINGVLGRGHSVVAEVIIPSDICKGVLRAYPQSIVDLVFHKNWIGSNLAGGVRSANAHFANMLLAFYLATGQDGANIVEGSQGFSYAYINEDEALCFCVSIPHLIVGVVGNGKNEGTAYQYLEMMGCINQKDGSKRLACIAAAVALCGELSLLAALCNRGELVDSHMRLERA